jgi:uncharacterized spore protein YtfJ
MDVETLVKQARDLGDAGNVRRVFGEPIERGGVTVIPVAAVRGGGGGGGGDTGPAENGDTAAGTGFGGGWGVNARPVGVYVIRGSDVAWEPARDLNRIVIGGQIVALAALLTLRVWLRHRR